MEKIFKNNNDGTLNVSVSYKNEEYMPIIDKVADKLVKKVQVKGFRPGKAPREMALRYISNEDLYNGMVNKIIDNDFPTLLDGYENKKDVANVRPSLSIDFDEKKKIYNFLYTFVLLPFAEVKKAEGYEVALETKRVLKKDVEAEIEKLRKDNAELVPAEGQEAKMGDHLVIDFVGYIDGKEFDGGSANDYELELGSHAFVPGFEEALVGMKEGERKTIEVTFPKDYLQSLAGKLAKFSVHCKTLKTVVLPELNDDFACSLQDMKCDTLEQLEAKVKEQIKTKNHEAAEANKLNKVFDLIKKDSKLVISDKYVELLSSQIEEQQLNQFKQYGLELNEYLKLTGSTMEAFKENCTKQAEQQATTLALLRGIAAKTNITWTDKDVEDKFGGKEKFDELMAAAKKQQEANPNFSVDLYLNNVKESIVQEKIHAYLLKNN